MIWITLLSLLILSNIVGFLVMTAPAMAAVPPMRADDRAADAQHIVVGCIREITTEEVTVDWGTDHHYTAIVDVNTVEKGTLPLSPTAESPPAATIPQIVVHYWQYGDRPLDWSGNAGQGTRLVTGTTVRLFLWQDAQGQLNLLTPNGWGYVD